MQVVAAAVAAAAADPRSTLAAKLDVTTTPPREAPVLPLAMSGDGTGPAVTLGVTEEPPKVKKSLAALTGEWPPAVGSGAVQYAAVAKLRFKILVSRAPPLH